jgi:hypothetical protein
MAEKEKSFEGLVRQGLGKGVPFVNFGGSFLQVSIIDMGDDYLEVSVISDGMPDEKTIELLGRNWIVPYASLRIRLQ